MQSAAFNYSIDQLPTGSMQTPRRVPHPNMASTLMHRQCAVVGCHLYTYAACALTEELPELESAEM